MDQLENSYYDENDKKEMELENVRELELTISDLEQHIEVLMFDEKTCRKTKTELERDLTMRTKELSDKVEICKSEKELDKISCTEKIEELENNQVKDG